MVYRCVTKTSVGFVQQLVSCYLPHGYWFYVSGVIPPWKDSAVVDRKLVEKYGIDVCRSTRARRKAAGFANLHYIRHEQRFLLLATHGLHPFYGEEAKNIRDVRRVPIKFEGYSISVVRGGFLRKTNGDGPAIPDRKWRVRVRIEAEMFKGLKAYFDDIALHRTAGHLATELADLPFEPYAPVRQQLLNLIRYINRRRQAAGLEPVGFSALRYRRRIVHPFDLPEISPTMADRIVVATGD